MKFVVTENSIYLLSITQGGFKVTKLFSKNSSSWSLIKTGSTFISKTITLAINEPMIIENLMTSSVMEITDELPITPTT